MFSSFLVYVSCLFFQMKNFSDRLISFEKQFSPVWFRLLDDPTQLTKCDGGKKFCFYVTSLYVYLASRIRTVDESNFETWFWSVKEYRLLSH